jgi:SNF2 family DNA or RNA helicase
LKYNPHSYQEYATDFIDKNPVSCLLLDMGLGKTAITLTALCDLLFDSFEAHRILVITPLRVASQTWPDELRKWEHLSDLRFSVAVGTEAERKAALKVKADIYIINRENVQWLIEDSGIPFNYDTVVIDELSSFKNHQTKRFRSLMKARHKVKRVIGLTGTPSSNGLMDLWAEFRLLDMGQRLGRFIGQYRTAYFIPDKRNGQVIFSYKPLPNAEKQIYDKIADITISMKSTDHLTMPELVTAEYPVTLSGKERERYDDLKQDLVLKLAGGDVTAANAAALSGKLCQMANGAVYGDDGIIHHIHDRKWMPLKI